MVTEETSGGREVPEDVDRQQVLLREPVRNYIRTRSRQESLTYSQLIDDWVPDTDYVHEIPDDEVVNIKATPEVHEKVTEKAGSRVSPGDIIAYWALVDAIEEGHAEIAADLAQHVPDTIWETMAPEVGDG